MHSPSPAAHADLSCSRVWSGLVESRLLGGDSETWLYGSQRELCGHSPRFELLTNFIFGEVWGRRNKRSRLRRSKDLDVYYFNLGSLFFSFSLLLLSILGLRGDSQMELLHCTVVFLLPGRRRYLWRKFLQHGSSGVLDEAVAIGVLPHTQTSRWRRDIIRELRLDGCQFYYELILRRNIILARSQPWHIIWELSGGHHPTSRG